MHWFNEPWHNSHLIENSVNELNCYIYINKWPIPYKTRFIPNTCKKEKNSTNLYKFYMWYTGKFNININMTILSTFDYLDSVRYWISNSGSWKKTIVELLLNYKDGMKTFTFIIFNIILYFQSLSNSDTDNSMVKIILQFWEYFPSSSIKSRHIAA